MAWVGLPLEIKDYNCILIQKGMVLCVKCLHENVNLPNRGSDGAVGYDLYSDEDIVIDSSRRALVGTGIAIVLPVGTYGRVAPRSGLALKHGIHAGAGVIDRDYRGEVKVLLFNHGETAFTVKRGDRIAQLILERCETPDVRVVDTLDDTTRGAGGFGSTGIF